MAHRNILRSDFEELVVGSDKEVEAAGVKVQHPAERGTVGRCSVVDCGVEPFCRFHIGVEATFGPRLATCDIGREQECSGKILVERHLVLGAEADCGVERFSVV